MFSVCVSVYIWWGVPHPRSRQGGGTPSQVQSGGGTPYRSRWEVGVPLPRSTWGVPHPRSRQGGYPIQVWGGVPHPRSRQGDTHPGFPPVGGAPTWGTPPPTPWQEQHSVYLLRGGRYVLRSRRRTFLLYITMFYKMIFSDFPVQSL